MKLMIYLGAQKYSNLKANLALPESKLQRCKGENYNLRRQLEESSAKHWKELQALQERLVCVTKKCESQMAIQNEKERRAGKPRNSMRECHISKRKLYLQTIETLPLKKEMAAVIAVMK